VTSPQRVTVFGVGNTARGDDGLGPLLLERLREAGWEGREWLRLIEDAQLQIEHALDLQRCDIALFVDASVDAPAPFSFEEIANPGGHRMATMSHALAPADVMHTLATIGRAAPPPAFVLGIRGEHFELGEGLSAAAVDGLAAATELVLELLQTPHLDGWRGKLRR
jgi:hydrogenase maturation protease